MIAPRHELARLQSDFYRDQFRKILRWTIGAVVIILFLIAIIIYLLLAQPTQRFYGNTTEGKILAMPRATVAK